MEKLILCVWVSIFTATHSGLARSDVYLLGDVTPVFSVSELDPVIVVKEGNQELFVKLLGPCYQPQACQVFLYPSANDARALSELEEFYTLKSIPVQTSDAVTEVELSKTSLIVVMPHAELSEDEIHVLRRLVRAGKHLLVLSEPVGCEDECIDRLNELLGAVGSDMRLNKDKLYGNWARVSEHGKLNGIPTVSYGATSSITGGIPLLLDASGENTILAFESVGPLRE